MQANALSANGPRHDAQNEHEVAAFKETSLPSDENPKGPRSGGGTELWWQDEARIGQKNKLTRRWAKRGTRPSALKDQCTQWAYIFGAICPAKGKGAGLAMPYADTHAMAEHLKLVSAETDPGAHTILLVDQAGWHTTPKLAVPDNITIIKLPPRTPELNPVENLWQFMRENWLSNRMFKNYDDILDHCSECWNKLLDQPWRIRTIGMREWAHGS